MYRTMNKIRNSYDYPYNLVSQILNEDGEPQKDLPDDIEVSVQYVLWKLRTQSERMYGCVTMFYQGKKTLKELGYEYGVTIERIRQIIQRALRILRSPGMYRYIKYGIAGVMKMSAEAELAKGYEIGYAQCLKDSALTAEQKAGKRNRSIEDMDLSVRAFNCLWRANLRTSDDIAKLDFYGLMKIRNLGRTTHREIIKVLDQLGYETKHMMEPEEM